MIRSLFTGVILLAGMYTLSAQESRPVEKIAAVVGDSIILASELDAYSYMKLNQAGQTPDQAAVETMRRNSLEELIDGKVLLVKAEQDTNITVTSTEIERELNTRIQYILKQNRISMDQFEELLQAEQGLTIDKFKSELRKQLRQELMKQKVQQRYISSQEISRSEVISFYEEYRDSLPQAGKSILLSKIMMDISPSETLRQNAFDKITSIKEKIDNGASFTALSAEYSDGPNAENGGDLGFISKGTLSELTFEEKAFSLKPGEISDPFETGLGFHLVKVLEKRENKIHIQQILVSVKPSEEKIARLTAIMDSIRTHCTDTASFRDAVRKFSTDEFSKSRGGRMKWQERSRLPSPVRTAVADLDIGDISEPVITDETISVFRVNDTRDSRILTLEEDWGEIESIAKRIYVQKKLVTLVDSWRTEVYIDIRL